MKEGVDYKMKVALYQGDIELGDVKKNSERVTAWMEQLSKEKSVNCVILPELWSSGYAYDQLEQIASQEKQTKALLVELANTYKVHIIGGSIVTKRENKFYNTALVYNKEGALVNQYDKVHLVPMLNEPDFFAAGQEPPRLFTLDGLTIGIMICYDLRFPELARKLTLAGADVLVIPAEWPKARTAVWRTLLQARAIENQVYVIGVNRIGSDTQTAYGGHSVVIRPSGDVVEEATEDKGTIIAALKKKEVEQIREDIPLLKDRKPGLY